ncbi:hypothetical protein RI367_000598 [Sorochytrium milnesiophthora]
MCIAESVLGKQLSTWLSKTTNATEEAKGGLVLPNKDIRAVIAPHAGYSYSGQAAAWAYACLDLGDVETIFVLGPSHHRYLDGCAVSRCTQFATPLGVLKNNMDTCRQLMETGEFIEMDQSTDEDEHSIEMHLPYLKHIIAKANRDDAIRVVPVLVGALSAKSEAKYGRLFAPYLADPKNLFVISSDFCHWGRRFQYTAYVADADTDLGIPGALASEEGPKSKIRRLTAAAPAPEPHELEIWESIEVLDRAAIAAIESKSHSAFVEYLKATKNTVCGRHPIGVLLSSIEHIKHLGDPRDGIASDEKPHGNGDDDSELAASEQHKRKRRPSTRANSDSSSDPDIRIKFVHYSQSSPCKTLSDSSVSYASAYVYMPSVGE